MVQTQKLTIRKNPRFSRAIVPAIIPKELRKILKMKSKNFHIYGEKFETPNGDYFYKDNGAKILLIAHLDTVQPYHWQGALHPPGDTHIHCSTVDDRLGAYTIIDILTRAGIKADWLFTTGEEQRASSAQYFNPPPGKEYNWIASFDKAGKGFKMYQYDDNFEAVTAAESAGFTYDGRDGYSCISELENLGVVGYNFGIGYHNHHSPNAFAIVSEMEDQIRSFMDFYQMNYHNKFKHTPMYNVVDKDFGFMRDRRERNIFDEASMEFAQVMYEKAQAGEDPESLGFDPEGIASATHVELLMRREEVTDIANNDPKIKGSEDDVGSYTFGRKRNLVAGEIKPIRPSPIASPLREAIIIPHPHQAVEEILNKARKEGLQAAVIDKCIECGEDFELPKNTENGMLVAYCPNCVKIKQDLNDEKDHKELSKIQNRALLESVEQYPTAQNFGMVFRALRESVKVTDVNLIEGIVKAAGEKVKEQIPARNDRKRFTLSLAADLAKIYGIDLAKASGNTGVKFLQKLEKGKILNNDMAKDYLALLAEYVPVEQQQIISGLLDMELPGEKDLKKTLPPVKLYKIFQVSKGSWEFRGRVEDGRGKKKVVYYWEKVKGSAVAEEAK